MDAISINALTKYYGKARGIDRVSLTVGQGEFFGFIGPNGAGKSTTIRTLLGLIRPTTGEAEILGMDIRKDREKILAQVGYLPSEAVFYPGMRVRDVLKLSAGLRKKDCRKAASRLCERLLLDPSRKVDELSFGNRKKAAIVCALQHDPRLLILDEPTSGLDPLMQREFFEILRERNAAGATVFLSSHILSEIQHHCTRAAIIREGRIIACDRVEVLSRTSAKRVSFCGAADLNRLTGVRGLQTAGGAAPRQDSLMSHDQAQCLQSVSFLYSGDMHALLKVLSDGDIRDLSISEPDLEEIFLHYYEDGGAAL